MSLTLHTTLGDLKLELYCNKVPVTAYNFIALAASGSYDGTRFLRNVKGCFVQGGDTSGTGKGGECVWTGLMPDEFSPELRHDMRGIVSMASSKPDRVGSQFFITYGPLPHLNDAQTIVGKVLFGWETLDKMERAPVKNTKKYRPETPIILKSITIHANPFADANRIIPPPERVDSEAIKPKKKKRRANPKSE